MRRSSHERSEVSQRQMASHGSAASDSHALQGRVRAPLIR
ncbi:hypothetical protein NK6_3350 [Bradyrhizobium diazoefficiens]|uniref:Uncharacterized protein n=1 Tax=Bradyrhizobium diazoefficiens TaxID=1355477 RepID=A0A0E4BNA7_9BRAD|nr:hypothetical protein NK6_3350 [Bradyrhizobium diazoefficiens]